LRPLGVSWWSVLFHSWRGKTARKLGSTNLTRNPKSFDWGT
jgi:hypothetical protein